MITMIAELGSEGVLWFLVIGGIVIWVMRLSAD
jgi:hypothetical protein